ncbi:hypothetical protein AB0L47_38310 [Streptomyces bobili]|uniref:DUF6153 family protein n=1 Tax=Streptomyces bobili TaxID=67280 RepID=UPI003425D7DB
MKASRNVRAGGALGHLLLVVLLALGVFAMHGMGHPSESDHAGMSTTSSSASTDAAAPGHTPMSAPADDMAAGGRATDAAGEKAQSSSTHEPAMTMDLVSLCVAVLFGAWALSALVRSALARRREWLAELLARLTTVARPDPPPRGPDLTRLSVLRL